ncbi:MAG: C1 family peptidase [Acidimicrobiales bacterium]
MSESWGNLEETERAVIQASARTMSDSEINERFKEEDDRVTFKIVRKTARAMAGDLDVTFTSDPDISMEEALPGDANVAMAADALEEQEVVEVTLISMDDFDYEPELTDEDYQAAAPIDAALADLGDYFEPGTTGAGIVNRSLAGDGGDSAPTSDDAAALPMAVDHRPDQSSIKDQARRGTCVSHAALALLEAFDHIPDDLSEQYTHYKFNEFLGRPQNADQGLRTTDAAPFLARGDGRTCLESQWPYMTQASINQQVSQGTYGPSATAQANDDYGYGAYKIITDRGLTGQSIKNTRYLEALLYKGYNIVIGTYVSWADSNNDGIREPVLDSNGDPVRRGGHAMVVVGYDRGKQYFIVKNSWGSGWDDGGYGYLHYSYIRSCFKYGYVVDSVVPAAPSQLPTRLANAPYNTSKISRPDLRAAIVFFKTSAGRFAVAEAYAGYNLYLRNLRVYNANGSVHLEKDELVIRGTYLCDIDSGSETSTNADFWWEAVRPGVNNLVPRNGASAVVAYDLAGLRPDDISALSMPSSPISWARLDYSVVVGKTTTGRRYKMLVHAKPGNKLAISYLEVFNQDDSRYRYKTDFEVPSSWTYNLDTLQLGGGQYADIWWHVVSDGVGFLEKSSYARTGYVWSL